MSTNNTKEHTLYIRVPPSLKLAVSRDAAREGLSLNRYVQRLLEKHVMQDHVRRKGDAAAVSAVAWLKSLTERK